MRRTPAFVRATAAGVALVVLSTVGTVAAGAPAAAAVPLALAPLSVVPPSGQDVTPAAEPGQPAPQQTEPVVLAEEQAEQAKSTNEPVEVPALRTATSSTFALPEGQLRTEVSLLPVHYQDAAGAWQPVDDRLVPADGGGWQAAAVGFDVQLPASLAAGPVRVQQGGTWVELRLDGAASTAGQVEGNAVTYPGVFPGVDVILSVTGSGVQKMIRLADAKARSDFAFAVRTSPDTTLKPTRNGVQVTQPGAPGFVIPLPWAVDQTASSDSAAPAGSKLVQLSAGKAADGWALRLRLDRAWLADPARQFPVLLDPSVYRQDSTMADCHIYEGNQTPDTTYCGQTLLEVGGSLDFRRRALMRFDLTAIPSSATVTDASLRTYLSGVRNATGGAAVQLRKVLQSWDAGSASWPCRDQYVTVSGCNPWTTAGGYYTGTTYSTATVSSTVGSTANWAGWGHLAQDWVNNPASNNGLILRPETEGSSQVFQFAAAEHTSDPSPRAQVTWVPRLGEQSFEVLYRDRLTDRSDIGVNVATGNLIVRATDLNVNGTGQDFAVQRTYNALAAKHGIVGPAQGNGALGSGWRTGTLTDTALYVTKTYQHAEFYGPDGRVITFRWTGSAWVSPPAANATLSPSPNSSNQYVLTMHDSNLQMYFSRGDLDEWLLQRTVDRNGNTITNTFAGDGSAYNTAVTDTQKRVFNLGYITADTGAKRLGSVTDPTGRKQTYGYTSGRLSSVQNGEPTVTPTTYSYTSGLLSKITDPSGRQTTITYDTAGRAVSITRVTDNSTGAGHTTTFSYSTDQTKTTVTDARGKNTTYTLDSKRRVSSVTDALGHARSRTYTSNSTVASFTGAATGTTTFGYGANNGQSMTSRRISTGGTYRAEYGNAVDGAGRQYLPTTTRTPRESASNTSTTVSYDAAGNLARTLAATEDSKSAHNRNGTLRSTTTPNNIGTKSGRTECASTDTSAPGATTQYDNCTAVTYAYNTAGQLTRKTATPPLDTKWLGASTTSYDPLTGRVSSSRDGRGVTTTYSYDGLDRPTKVSYSDGTPAISYTYDGAGNRLTTTDASGTTSTAYDSRNLPQSRTIPNRGTLDYRYDAVGNMTSSTEAGQTTSYVYDAANRLDYMTEPGSLKTDFGYDNDDRRTTTSYPNAVKQTVSYDGAGRVRSVYAAGPTGTLVNLTYCYAVNSPDASCSTATADDRDLLQWRHDSVTGRTTHYDYGTDGRDRLKQARDGVRTYNYGYDKNGNRISDSVTGDRTESNSYAHDVADALCSRRSGTTTGANCTDTSNTSTTTIFTHDGAGNMTANGGTTAAYNGANQTTRYGTPTFSYSDTGQGDRLTAGGRNFTNGLLGVQQYSDSGSTTHIGSTPDGQLVSITLPDGTKHYYLFDHQGSVLGLTDAGGARTATYTYDPYGAHATASGTAAAANRFRYISGYFDTTGLYKLGIRYYNPHLGRFTQLDPTGQDPHYTYAGNNPINFTDPTGASFGSKLSLITGALGLAAVGVAFIAVSPVVVGVATLTGALLGTISVTTALACEINPRSRACT